MLYPEQLVRHFGSKSSVTRDGISTLYNAIQNSKNKVINDSLTKWQTLFETSSGQDLDRQAPNLKELAKQYNIRSEKFDPKTTLFSLQTYYALIVKLLVWKILAQAQRHPRPSAKLLQIDDYQLQDKIKSLENGSLLNEFGIGQLSKCCPFSWYATLWSKPIIALVREVLSRLDSIHFEPEQAATMDLLGLLHHELFPAKVRHPLGEYYTPGWLTENLLDKLDYSGEIHKRLLDPSCGSGTFILAAIRRILSNRSSGSDLRQSILQNVVGYDINPLAVITARANYILAIIGLLDASCPVEIPIYLRDSILYEGRESFDLIVGNPPWIGWESLPIEYRNSTKALWQHYGLFSLSGNAARHGGGKKDLSMLMMYAVADRFLKDKGRLGFIITQTSFQTKGAGDGFRRFQIGQSGPPLRVLSASDMVRMRPFPGISNWTGTIILQKGKTTTYPIPYTKWFPSTRGEPPKKRRYKAQPIDPQKPTSPWFFLPDGFEINTLNLVGPSQYSAHLGANSGGANCVYWIKPIRKTTGGLLIRNIASNGKNFEKTVEAIIEPHLVYPLIRWGDVSRYKAVPNSHIILPQDVQTRRGIDQQTMKRQYPKTIAYLEKFQKKLAQRAAYRRYQSHAAYYSMYNVGEYTLSPIKVIWRRMDRRINAAVIAQQNDPLLGRRPIIPQETCSLIAIDSLDEAHYICAILNSSIANFVVASHSVRGGKGFGTPSMLDYIMLHRFDKLDRRHTKLSTASRMAHELVSQNKDPSEIQDAINLTAGSLLNLTKAEISTINAEVEMLIG